MAELTGRERLLRVLHQQPVDRIPVSPFIHVNYVQEFFGTHQVDCVIQTPAVYRHFGFDLIHRNCTPDYDAFGPQGPDWQIESVSQVCGRDLTTWSTIHTPQGTLGYQEATRWTCEYDAEYCLLEYPIKSEADLDRMIRFRPPPGSMDGTDMARARATIGDEGILAPWIDGVFNLVAFYYRRLEDLLVDAVLNPAFYQAMMAYFLERHKHRAQQLIDAGADVLAYSGNIANGKLVSPGFFRVHIAPYEKDLIEFIQAQGVAVLYHNCGYARNLLPLYPSLGMRAYESLTPPPYGDTLLDETVAILGATTALSGNIDQISLLRYGTREDIERQVQNTLDTVRGRCHFILATTDYFNENTPHDNIHALAEAGMKFGHV